MKQNNQPSELYERIFESEQKKRVAEAESEARRQEAAHRTAMRKKSRSAFRVIATFLTVLVVFGVLLGVVYKFIFVISDLRVTGNERYSAEEIFSVAGVKTGDNLYSFSSRIAGERLRSRLSYIRSLKVERDIPNKITFTVEEYEPRFYAYIYGCTYILSGDLTVLESIPGKEKKESLCLLRLPAVRESICGRTLRFRSDIDQNHITAAVAAALSSDLSERVTAMSLTDTYALFMECDHKYLLNFGGFSDTAIKLRVAAAVMKDDMFNSENKMRIDLTDNTETTVIVDNTLVFE